MRIEIVPAYDRKEEICSLFSEYTDMLIREDPSIREYLEIQDYEEERKHLEKKYGQPYGRLYLACCAGQAAGCVGLKPLTKEERGTNGELKRLYVRPEFRGNRLGSLLMSRILEDAGEIGYRHIYLDTLPFLQSAVYLYRKFGFYEIEKYNNSPVESTIYMRLDL